MTNSDKLFTAVFNLGRRKVRTVLTSMGVVVGTLTIVTMVSLATGVRLEINKQFEEIGLERVWVRPAGEQGERGIARSKPTQRGKVITASDVARWKKWPGVKDVEAEVELPPDVDSTLVMDGKNAFVGIVGDGRAARRNPFAEPPAALAGVLDLSAKRGALVLSQGVLQAMKIPRNRFAALVGRPVKIVLQSPRGEKQSFSLRVLGVSAEEDTVVQVAAPDRIAMKSWWFNDPRLLETQGYDAVTLHATDVGEANVLVRRLKKEGFEVQSIELILDMANRIFSVVTVMLAAVGGVALFVASIGIANTMIMAIYERTREIGTLKAMGASRGDIRQMFMIEAGLIGLMGGALGLFLGWALGQVFNRAIVWYMESRDIPIRSDFFVVTPVLALQVLLFATLIGIVAGLYPAHRAARLDPLAALRHE